MPHLTVEYSANIESRADVGGLCDRLLRVVLDTGLFEMGAVRVRAIRCDHYAIADAMPDNAFVDLSLRIGQGRSFDDKRRAGEAIFAAAGEALAPLFESPHFALSLEIREIERELSWRRNAMHARLRHSPSQGERHVQA